MPGFPLMAFGAGLGRFAEDYRQQQYANTQRQYVQMALDKQRQENEARDLMGVALTGGGLPGFGSGGGSGPITAGGGVGVPVASGGFPGSGAMPQSAPAPQSPTPQPAPAPATPFAAAAARDPFYDEREAMPGYAAPGSPGVIDLDAPAPANAAPVQPAPPGGGAAASAASQPASATGFDVVGETKDGRVIFDVPNVGKMDLTSMFRQVDPQAIAQRIKELRPNASPAAIASATEQLYKLGNSGSKIEQLQTATLLRYLSATRSQDVRQNIASGNQATQARGQDIRAGTAAAGQQSTADTATKNRESREANQALNREQRERLTGRRQSDLQAQRAQAIATGQTKMQLVTLERQMADVRGRMTLIINGSNPSSPANKTAMDNFNKQLDDIEQRRDAIAGQVLGSREKTE